MTKQAMALIVGDAKTFPLLTRLEFIHQLTTRKYEPRPLFVDPAVFAQQTFDFAELFAHYRLTMPALERNITLYKALRKQARRNLGVTREQFVVGLAVPVSWWQHAHSNTPILPLLLPKRNDDLRGLHIAHTDTGWLEVALSTKRIGGETALQYESVQHTSSLTCLAAYWPHSNPNEHHHPVLNQNLETLEGFG